CPPAERQSQDFGVSVPPSGPLIQHIPGWQPPNPSRCRCRFQKTARKCAPGAGSSYRPSIITPCYDFYYTIPAPQRNGKCAITFLSALWLSVWLRRPWPVPGQYPYRIHIRGFLVLPPLKNLLQGLARFQQRPGLTILQIVVFKRHQDVLPHRVLVGVVQNLSRRLGKQPVPELLLFCKHFLIEPGIQFFVGHRILLYRASSTTLRAGTSSPSSGVSSINVLS